MLNTQSPKKVQLRTPIGSGDHEVQQGECVFSIAYDAGHIWQRVWNDPANAALRNERGDPSLLLPGDRLTVPPIEPKTVAKPTDQRHRFVRKCVPSMLRMVVKDMDEPLGSQPYTLIVDGVSRSGVTDAEGRLEEFIPPNAKRGLLIVGTDDDQLEFELDLGTIDPIESITGIQARLENLGYEPGPIDGVLGEKTWESINEFCSDQSIDPPEGVIDQDFRDALLKAHGF